MAMLRVIYQTRCGTFLHHHTLQKDVQAGMSSFGKKSSRKVKIQKALNMGINNHFPSLLGGQKKTKLQHLQNVM